MKDLTQEEAIRLFDYNPETGDLTRLVNVSNTKAGDLIRSIDGMGYFRLSCNGHSYLAHRVIWLMVYGEFPLDQIDHINGIKKDNRIDNLRDVSRSENGRNSKKSIKNTSGFIGVQYDKRRNNWYARAQDSDFNTKYLGSFANKSDAVNARLKAEIEYGYHENHGRI